MHRRLLNDAVHQNEEVNQEKERHGIQETGTQPSKEVKKNSRVLADTIVTTFEHTEKREIFLSVAEYECGLALLYRQVYKLSK